MSGIACFNIGPHQRRIRLRMGAIMLGAALAIGIALIAADAPRAMRLVLFAPLLLASLGFVQAQSRTCVALAAKQLRNLDAGNERITDPAEATLLKKRARHVWMRSIALATLLTAALGVL